ncbi:MAG: hypothetical protein IIC93_05750 [Chloroflexi bacterium]|nr:hypothetical protein [Chloroflexota bacterium]
MALVERPAQYPAGTPGEPVVTTRQGDLPVFPRFPREVLPALGIWWTVTLGLFFALEDYYLVVALIGTPTIAMLWPAGRTLGHSYLSYRTVPWVTAILTMWIILVTGLAVTETGWSFNVKSGFFFALPAVIAFGGILVALPWAQARTPIRMFFRPDLLFGDGRTLVGGTLMLVLGLRYLFAGHPPDVDWALPAWNWNSLAFGVAVGIIPIVLMRGMLKLVQRLVRLRDGLFSGYPSIAFRELLLLLLALNFGFAFHHLFIGRTVFSTIGEPGAFPITTQFWTGVALMIAVVPWMIFVKGRIKKRIGEPFFFETFSQTLLKQVVFTAAWVVFFYGFMSVLNGEAFGTLQDWDAQSSVGLGFFVTGVLVLTIGRAIAQHYQRKGMMTHFLAVILPTQPDRARERMMARIVQGLARLSPERQRKAWADMFRAWDAADPADRSLMTWTAVVAVAEMPANQRNDLTTSRSEALALLDDRTSEQAMAGIRGAEAHLDAEKNKATEG